MDSIIPGARGCDKFRGSRGDAGPWRGRDDKPAQITGGTRCRLSGNLPQALWAWPLPGRAFLHISRLTSAPPLRGASSVPRGQPIEPRPGRESLQPPPWWIRRHLSRGRQRCLRLAAHRSWFRPSRRPCSPLSITIFTLSPPSSSCSSAIRDLACQRETNHARPGRTAFGTGQTVESIDYCGDRRLVHLRTAFYGSCGG